MLLIRPDIMYKMPVHNMNQKLRNNAVLLNWVTTYRKYVDSKLFKIADDYFMKQQDQQYLLGQSWNHYFPYKIQAPWKQPDNLFIELKIAKFNSTIHLYSGILFCTSGV